MKPGHYLITAAVFTTFLATYMFAGLTPTGYAAADLPALQHGASIVFYSLVGLVAVAVVGRIGYEQAMSNRNGMAGHIRTAEKMLSERRHDEARTSYTAAREVYASLSTEEKLKHYDTLVNLHGQISEQIAVQRAQQLAEKYADNTITSSEMRELNQLLSQ
jgi:hypothetical protein